MFGILRLRTKISENLCLGIKEMTKNKLGSSTACIKCSIISLRNSGLKV